MRIADVLPLNVQILLRTILTDLCKPSVCYLWKLNIKTKQTKKMFPVEFVLTSFYFVKQQNTWSHTKIHAVPVRLTRLVLQVVETLASLYHLGDVLLHHIDHLINL